MNIFAQDQKKLDSLLHVYSAQKEDSSKSKTLNEIIKFRFFNNPDEITRKYIEEMIELSKKINRSKGVSAGYYWLGEYFRKKNILDSSAIFIKKAIAVNEKIKNLRGLALDYYSLEKIYNQSKKFDSVIHYANKFIDLYNNRDRIPTKKHDVFENLGDVYHILAGVYQDWGMYDLALKNEFKALKFYNENNMETDDFLKSRLGNIEWGLGNYKQALMYFEEAKNGYMLKHDTIGVAAIMQNQGNVFTELKDYDKAIALYKNAMILRKDDRLTEAGLWSNIGVCYFLLDKDKETINSFWKAYKLYKALNIEEPTIYDNIGCYYSKKNELDSALYYLNKAIKFSESDRDVINSSIAYNDRHEVYKKMGNYQQALEDFKAHTKLKDSMFNKTKSQQIEELRIIYDTEKKEQQIEIQEQEINVLTIKEKVYDMQRLLLAFGLLIAFIGVYALYQRNKRNRLAKEKAEMDLEHKTKELTTHALHLAKKNEVLNDIKEKAKAAKAKAIGNGGYQTLIQTINFDLQDDNNWENFSKYFKEVHKGFNAKAQQQFPNITSNDLRLMALIKMNLSSKEIANILNISADGVKKARQRLRKKMDLDPTDSLESSIIAI